VAKPWNIEINEDETQAIYFSHRCRPPESFLTLRGWNIPFVNNVNYLGVINKKIVGRSYIKIMEAKAFRAFIRTYSIFKSELLSANVKLTLHKALIRSVMTYALSCLGIWGRYPSVKIAAPVKQGSPHYWQFSKAHADRRIA
jgi:hypothetical protein